MKSQSQYTLQSVCNSLPNLLLSSLLALSAGLLTLSAVGCGGGGGGGGGGPVAPTGPVGSEASPRLVQPSTKAPRPAMSDPSVIVVEEVESNDTASGANLLIVGETAYGTVFDVDDVDYWQFDLTAGGLYRFEVRAGSMDPDDWNMPSGNELAFSIAGPSGAMLRSTRSSTLYESCIAFFEAPESGTYLIDVFSAISTSGGKYAISIDRVDVGTIQREIEGPGEMTNSDIVDAELVAFGVIAGYYDNDDLDHYRFEVPEDGLVYAEMFATRNGYPAGETRPYDPYLRLFDDAGNEIARNDDAFSFDSAVASFLEAGIYTIQVDEFSGQDTSDFYLLNLEFESFAGAADENFSGFPGDAPFIELGDKIQGSMPSLNTIRYRFDGQAGDGIRFEVGTGPSLASGGKVGIVVLPMTDPLNPVPSRTVAGSNGLDNVSMLLPETGVYVLEVSGIATSPNAITEFAVSSVLVFRSPLEVEPNGSLSEAVLFGPGRTMAGHLPEPSDRDLYRFEVEAGELVSLALHGGEESSGLARHHRGFGQSFRGVVRVLDDQGDEVTEVEISQSGRLRMTSTTEQLDVAFVAETAGTYYAEVAIEDGFFGFDSERSHYVLERQR